MFENVFENKKKRRKEQRRERKEKRDKKAVVLCKKNLRNMEPKCFITF